VECSIGSQDFSTAERDDEGKGEKFAPGSCSVECSIREPQGLTQEVKRERGRSSLLGTAERGMQHR